LVQHETISGKTAKHLYDQALRDGER
jgi:hypothetical protein